MRRGWVKEPILILGFSGCLPIRGQGALESGRRGLAVWLTTLKQSCDPHQPLSQSIMTTGDWHQCQTHRATAIDLSRDRGDSHQARSLIVVGSVVMDTHSQDTLGRAIESGSCDRRNRSTQDMIQNNFPFHSWEWDRRRRRVSFELSSLTLLPSVHNPFGKLFRARS